MFEYVKGILASAEPDCAIVDVGGIGYKIHIPFSTFNSLPHYGEEVTLLLHFYVREDLQKLYGFISITERELFRHLISVSKIGPKVALNVLSGLSVKDIIQAVQSSDSSKLKAISGIGLKTAQRLVMELKGKLTLAKGEPFDSSGINMSHTPAKFSSKTEAHRAMMSLGYSENKVVSALIQVEQLLEKGAPVEDWIKKALQVI